MTERSITNNPELSQTVRRQTGVDRAGGQRPINVSQVERWALVAGGGTLAIFGVRRGGGGGLLLALAGGALVYRGVTGHLNQMIETNEPPTPAGQPSRSVAASGGSRLTQRMVHTEGRVANYF